MVGSRARNFEMRFGNCHPVTAWSNGQIGLHGASGPQCTCFAINGGEILCGCGTGRNHQERASCERRPTDPSSGFAGRARRPAVPGTGAAEAGFRRGPAAGRALPKSSSNSSSDKVGRSAAPCATGRRARTGLASPFGEECISSPGGSSGFLRAVKQVGPTKSWRAPTLSGLSVWRWSREKGSPASSSFVPRGGRVRVRDCKALLSRSEFHHRFNPFQKGGRYRGSPGTVGPKFGSTFMYVSQPPAGLWVCAGRRPVENNPTVQVLQAEMAIHSAGPASRNGFAPRGLRASAGRWASASRTPGQSRAST